MDNRYKPWSEKEKEYIQDNYITKSRKEIADYLKRPYDSVRKWMKIMGLEKPKKEKLYSEPRKRGRKSHIKHDFLQFFESGNKEHQYLKKQAKYQLAKQEKKPTPKKEVVLKEGNIQVRAIVDKTTKAVSTTTKDKLEKTEKILRARYPNCNIKTISF